jgi:UDP-N-acetylglucosamine diphosphorylase/glucosamine-1-phosphate N-acetyltransferase
MQMIFFDTPAVRQSLKPFTLTRPAAEIRCGILTISEKWRYYLQQVNKPEDTAYLTEDYLGGKYPFAATQDALLLNGSVCPDAELAVAVAKLERGQALTREGKLVALRPKEQELQALAATGEPAFEKRTALLQEMASAYPHISHKNAVSHITHCWDIFKKNAEEIEKDFRLLTAGRSSRPLQDGHSIIYGDKKDIFIEEGVAVRASVINAESGPVYIGKNATVHENAVIKGPAAILEGAHVNMGAKIRDATTIGPYSKLGGEVKNVVVFGNSNKGHEGFLGNSVVGEWCNFGADTNSSNLKNNYKSVNLWNYATRSFEDSGELFCGLMMGDHSKCGINTMFNTGTVIGVFANIFGSGYPPRFIPSFSWGCVPDISPYRLDKALEVAGSVMQRRGIAITAADEQLLGHIFEQRDSETRLS